jgi:hypothetical protein
MSDKSRMSDISRVSWEIAGAVEGEREGRGGGGGRREAEEL